MLRWLSQLSAFIPVSGGMVSVDEICCQNMAAKVFQHIDSWWTEFGRTEGHWFTKELRKPWTGVQRRAPDRRRKYPGYRISTGNSNLHVRGHIPDRDPESMVSGWSSFCSAYINRAASISVFYIFTESFENKACFERNWSAAQERMNGL